MAILVIAEHDGTKLKPGVTNTVAAAAKMGGDISVLIAGTQAGDAAQAAAKIAGVYPVTSQTAFCVFARIMYSKNCSASSLFLLAAVIIR